MKFKVGDWVYFCKGIKGQIDEYFGEDYATEWTHYRIGGKCFKKEFIERINK